MPPTRALLAYCLTAALTQGLHDLWPRFAQKHKVRRHRPLRCVRIPFPLALALPLSALTRSFVMRSVVCALAICLGATIHHGRDSAGAPKTTYTCRITTNTATKMSHAPDSASSNLAQQTRRIECIAEPARRRGCGVGRQDGASVLEVGTRQVREGRLQRSETDDDLCCWRRLLVLDRP